MRRLEAKLIERATPTVSRVQRTQAQVSSDQPQAIG